MLIPAQILINSGAECVIVQTGEDYGLFDVSKGISWSKNLLGVTLTDRSLRISTRRFFSC